MKRLLTALLATTCLSASGEEVNLNGQWLFRYAPSEAAADSIAATGFHQPGAPLLGFVPVTVPSCWAIQGFEEPVYREFKSSPQSEGFYVTRFKVADAMARQRLLLQFGGVWASAEVWLNGERLGRHDSGYTSFALDATGKVKAGEDNVLAVRVRQVYPGYIYDTYDDWSLGGIYRDVTLTSMPRSRWIDDVKTTTRFDSQYKDADLRVEVMVADRHKNTLPGNYRSPGKPYRLHLTLSDMEGREVAAQQVDVPSHGATNRETTVDLHVADARQWNAEHPELYRLSVVLVEDGQDTQQWQQCIGLREISTEGGVLRINGQAVKLRGVNRHDEHPDVGRATRREHWLEDITMMKAAGINYIRAAHYQHARGFIELCDSLGMYVGSEVSIGGGEGLLDAPDAAPMVMTRVMETVRRDQNSPSVIYWSVGNEDAYTTWHHYAMKTIKAIDATRPTLLPWDADDYAPADVDILAPHYWTAAEYDSLCATSSRPVISTEYTHAYGTDRFGGLEDRWQAISRHPAGAGAAVWMWADQGIKTPTPRDEKRYGNIVKDNPYLRIDASGWDGIVDSYRRPTRDYAEVCAVYAPVKPTVRQVELGEGSTTAAIPIANHYDFTTLDGVDLTWTLMADNRRLDSGVKQLQADPHAVAMLSIPLAKAAKAKATETLYTIVTATDRTSGQRLSTTSVELKRNATSADRKSQKASSLPTIAETAEGYIVKAGDRELIISRQTGAISRIMQRGKTLVNDFMPTVWHKFNEGDNIIRNAKFAKDITPAQLTPTVRSMSYAVEGDSLVVTSLAEYVADADNRLSLRLRHAIGGDGKVSVSYTITTHFQTTHLPLVGMSFSMTERSAIKQWLGLGEADNWPGKEAAAQLGVWTDSQSYGTHAMRWMDIAAEGRLLRITADAHIVRDHETPSIVRLASRVLGRAEKGRLKEPGNALPAKGEYCGSFVIQAQ